MTNNIFIPRFIRFIQRAASRSFLFERSRGFTPHANLRYFLSIFLSVQFDAYTIFYRQRHNFL